MNSTRDRNPANAAEQWSAKGTDALNHRNWNYALQCMEEALKLDPNNLSYRRLKHRASRRKCGKDGTISKVNKVKLAAIKSRLMTAVMKKNWQSVDRLSEEGNSVNPFDSEFYANIARAASQNDNLKLAKYAWNAAVKLDDCNATYYREFGGVLQQLGDYENAKTCFGRIADIDPTGRVSLELIAAVDIASLIDLGGYAGARSTRDVRIDDDTDVIDGIEIEDDETIVPHDPQQELVAAVTLGEQHVQHGRLCSAMESYRAAACLAPENESIKRRLEDIELAYLRQQATAARANLLSNPQHNEVATAAAARMTELTSREFEIRLQRSKVEPHNNLYAFQLADFHRRTNQFAAAIPLFEQALSVEELKAESLIGLGECLIHSEKASLGHQHLTTALTMIDASNKPNAYKLAHYWLARLYEAQNYVQQSLHHYSTIASVDRSFRDVDQRLAKFAETKAI